MNSTEEALLEALEETREFAREIALSAGFLLAMADDHELLTAEGSAGGKAVLLGWHFFDMRMTELLERIAL